MSWNPNQMMESFLVCVEPPVEYLRALAPPQSDRFHQVNSAAQELRLWMENNARKSVLGRTWGGTTKLENLQRNAIFLLPERSFKIKAQL